MKQKNKIFFGLLSTLIPVWVFGLCWFIVIEVAKVQTAESQRGRSFRVGWVKGSSNKDSKTNLLAGVEQVRFTPALKRSIRVTYSATSSLQPDKKRVYQFDVREGADAVGLRFDLGRRVAYHQEETVDLNLESVDFVESKNEHIDKLVIETAKHSRVFESANLTGELLATASRFDSSTDTINVYLKLSEKATKDVSVEVLAIKNNSKIELIPDSKFSKTVVLTVPKGLQQSKEKISITQKSPGGGDVIIRGTPVGEGVVEMEGDLVLSLVESLGFIETKVVNSKKTLDEANPDQNVLIRLVPSGSLFRGERVTISTSGSASEEDFTIKHKGREVSSFLVGDEPVIVEVSVRDDRIGLEGKESLTLEFSTESGIVSGGQVPLVILDNDINPQVELTYEGPGKLSPKTDGKLICSLKNLDSCAKTISFSFEKDPTSELDFRDQVRIQPLKLLKGKSEGEATISVGKISPAGLKKLWLFRANILAESGELSTSGRNFKELAGRRVGLELSITKDIDVSKKVVLLAGSDALEIDQHFVEQLNLMIGNAGLSVFAVGHQGIESFTAVVDDKVSSRLKPIDCDEALDQLYELVQALEADGKEIEQVFVVWRGDSIAQFKGNDNIEKTKLVKESKYIRGEQKIPPVILLWLNGVTNGGDNKPGGKLEESLRFGKPPAQVSPVFFLEDSDSRKAEYGRIVVDLLSQ